MCEGMKIMWDLCGCVCVCVCNTSTACRDVHRKNNSLCSVHNTCTAHTGFFFLVPVVRRRFIANSYFHHPIRPNPHRMTQKSDERGRRRREKKKNGSCLSFLIANTLTIRYFFVVLFFSSWGPQGER